MLQLVKDCGRWLKSPPETQLQLLEILRGAGIVALERIPLAQWERLMSMAPPPSACYLDVPSKKVRALQDHGVPVYVWASTSPEGRVSVCHFIRWGKDVIVIDGWRDVPTL